jgi:hypothetical protein
MANTMFRLTSVSAIVVLAWACAAALAQTPGVSADPSTPLPAPGRAYSAVAPLTAAVPGKANDGSRTTLSALPPPAQSPLKPDSAARMSAASVLSLETVRSGAAFRPAASAANVGSRATLSSLQPPAQSVLKPASAATMSGATALAMETARSGAAFRPAAVYGLAAAANGAGATAALSAKAGLAADPAARIAAKPSASPPASTASTTALAPAAAANPSVNRPE